MSATQATVGLGLMKKVMPDLASVALSNENDEPFKVESTGEGAAKLAAALDAIAERSGKAGEPDA